ncbi:uncharacterized protein LOC129913051 isoform X5 [Episyrphus balteatus]|nr:uncharacterized protein LOC129913051 isoform X5 [Episyrphus balteatus]
MKRDIYKTLETFMDGHGFDGKACILKSFCTAMKEGPSQEGILFKTFKTILALNEHDRRHFKYLKDENCDQILHHHCPLSFNSISPFTDDV